MTAYTKSEREFLEQMAIKKLDLPFEEPNEEAPESELAKKIRKYCQAHAYPALIFPQTADVRNYLPPGYPDVTIIMKDRVIFLELKKVKSNRKSKVQKDMALKFAFLGNPIHECKTYKRFLEVIYK